MTAGRLDFEVITPYNSSGFSASWYHTASSSMDVGGVKNYAGRTKLLGLSGIIRTNQDETTGALTFLQCDLTATGRNGTTFEDEVLTFRITGGSLTRDANDRADGTIGYQVRDGNTIVDEGTFHFFPIAFTGGSEPPNTLTFDSFTLWGNNWNNLDYPTGAPSSVDPDRGLDTRRSRQENRAYERKRLTDPCSRFSIHARTGDIHTRAA